MATSLATMRTRVKTILDDTGNAFWSDAEIDEHIQAALRDLSHSIPRQQKTAIATVNGSRDLSIASLANLVRVVAVEFKTGQDPPSYVRFGVWGTTLTIVDGPVPDGTNCNIFWESLHSINGTTTLPEDHDEILKFGAAWKACEQQAADAANTLQTTGLEAPRQWATLAQRYEGRYLSRLRRRRGVIQHATHEPLEPLPTQSSDPGP